MLSIPAAQLFPGAAPVPGRILFVKEGNLWLWTGGRSRQLTSGQTWRQPKWSPDGAEIAYVYTGLNFSEIFVMNADGSNNRRLTRGQSASLTENDWNLRPTWSPNGGQIAFVSDNNSYSTALWIMNRDGSGVRQLMQANDVTAGNDGLAWSPDGRQLAVAAFGRETSQIVLLDTQSRSVQAVTSHSRGALDPAISPDGALLAYAARETGIRMDIRVRVLETGAELVITDAGLARAPGWSPDGGKLAYVSDRRGSFELYVVDIAIEGDRLISRNERQLTSNLNIEGTSGLSWAR